MSEVIVAGCGAVSPAGWGMAAMREAVEHGVPVPATQLPCPQNPSAPVRTVPRPSQRLEFMSHPRLRRTSPISQFTVAAAIEAMGTELARIKAGEVRLGIVLCVMCGCVNYSRRFYHEALHDPATASPLIFPETVFNAPASHLAAWLGNTGVSYTLMGDQGTFLQGVALGASWLCDKRVDACLVIGAEEMDWVTVTAARLFDPDLVLAEGAGALYLTRERGTAAAARLRLITEPVLFTAGRNALQAARQCRADAGPGRTNDLLCDGLQGCAVSDAHEKAAWLDWVGPRLSPKRILGEAFMAASAWQCTAAVDALRSGKASGALVSIVGSNQQAVAARFERVQDSI